MTVQGKTVGEHHPIERHVLVKLSDDGPVFGSNANGLHFAFLFEIKKGPVRLQNLRKSFLTFNRITGSQQIFVRIMYGDHFRSIHVTQQFIALLKTLHDPLITKTLLTIMFQSHPGSGLEGRFIRGKRNPIPPQLVTDDYILRIDIHSCQSSSNHLQRQSCTIFTSRINNNWFFGAFKPFAHQGQLIVNMKRFI